MLWDGAYGKGAADVKGHVKSKTKNLGLAVLALLGIVMGNHLFLAQDKLGEAAKQVLATELCSALYRQFLPAVSWMQGEDSLLQSQITDVMPLYGYAGILAQTREDPHEGVLYYEELFPDTSPDVTEPAAGEEEEEIRDVPAGDMDSIESLLKAENEAAMLALEEQNRLQTPFVPHGVQSVIDLSLLTDYETLVHSFYTIDSNTMAGSDQLNVEALTSYDMTIDKTAQGPQILIYHTHSQEAFADSLPGDEGTSIVGVGDRLAQILTEQYGYQVLHHRAKYDLESRNDAYAESLPDLERILAENPSIQVVIDLHRDAVAEGTRLVTEVDGRPTARFMFFNGLSRTKKTGSISYLYNGNQGGNLAFSFQMQLAAETYYPGLARKIYLKGYRYNLHLLPRSLLIELGAQTNTVEEAMNACDPIAHILDAVLSGQ